MRTTVMADEQGIYTAAFIAERVQGRLSGDGAVTIRGFNSVDDASTEELTFVADGAHARRLEQSRAAAAIMTEGLPVPEGACTQAIIYVPDARRASAAVLELFRRTGSVPAPGVHPTAVVHETARLGRGVRVGPHASIDRGCVLGDDVILHAGVRLYAAVTVGAGTVIHANSVIRDGCRIGTNVILHSNVSIGTDGFGFVRDPATGRLAHIPHLGTVEIGDDVELGASCCIDRGKFGATVIGRGSKLDNHVQIAHNCQIGTDCIVAGHSAIAGTCIIGDGVTIGGAVRIADHVTVGPGASVGGASAVNRDIPAGATWLGYPADERRAALRQMAALRKLPDLIQRMPGLDRARGQRPSEPDADRSGRPATD